MASDTNGINEDELEELKSRLRAKVDDFVEYAHPIFLQHGWTYYDGTPDKDRLRGVCNRLISSLKPGTRSSAQTGHIQVFYHVYDGTAHASIVVKDHKHEVRL